MITSLAFSLTALLAMLGLLRVWRRRDRVSHAVRTGSWLLLFGITAGWALVEGPEYGITFALLLFSLVAIAVLAATAAWQSPAQPAKTETSQPLLESSGGAAFGTFMVIGPLAATAMAFLSIALIGLMPISRVSGLAIAAFLFPLAWAVVATIVSMRNRKGRDAVVLGAVAALSGAYLYFPVTT
ncbi:MAG: hypothetical protein AAGI11_08125 [Pseudomonadota bacterium]